jgi:hypothetical protein
MVGRALTQLDEQFLQQALRRNDSIRAQQQERQQRPLLRATYLKRLPISKHSERAEDPKTQPTAQHVRRSLPQKARKC